jgi:Flp pilus assembly protein TadD
VKRLARYLAASLLLSALFALPAFAANAAPAAAKLETSGASDSLAMLEKAVARDSSKFDNLYRLGVMYLDRDRPAEAARVFSKANKVKPKNTKVLVNLGAAYDALGNAALAQDQYRQALVVTPGDSVANCRLASSLYSQGKHQEAMDILRETIAKKPNSYCAYFTLGVAFADAGIYRDAVRMWQKVIDLAPESPEAVSAKESIEVLEKFIQQ